MSGKEGIDSWSQELKVPGFMDLAYFWRYKCEVSSGRL